MRSAPPYLTSDVARLVGVSADTVRLYERRGLVPRPPRGPNGYREYGAAAVERVRLVRRALSIGFTLDELRIVLGARDRGEPPCRVVRTLAAEKADALGDQIRRLKTLRDRIRRVLRQWDARLTETPRGQPARLLEMLAAIVPDGDSPHVPRGWHRARSRRLKS